MGQEFVAAVVAGTLLGAASMAVGAEATLPLAYSVTELRFKPLDPGLPNTSTPAAIDAKGRAVINVYAGGSTAGEQCSMDGKCKPIGPAEQNNYWLAAAGKMLGGWVVSDGQGWAVRRGSDKLIERLWVGDLWGINASGTAVGSANSSAVVFDTELHILPDLSGGGGQTSVANGINKAGLVVGASTGPLRNYCAVAWENYALQVLQCAPAIYDSFAYAVNAKGVAVGESSYVEARRPHAVRYEKGVAIDLGTLGGTPSDSSAALAINTAGVIVGKSTDAPHGSASRATRFDKTGPVDLATLISEADRAMYVMQHATAINDAGQILVDATRTGEDLLLVLRLDPLPATR